MKSDSNGNTILHMLVICNLPEIYEKFKARWIERQINDTNIDGTEESNRESSKLWNRLNDDNLTPLTLAADLSRSKILSWLLNERKQVQWSYGDISCALHPLDQLDVGLYKEVS
jgi:hypothetical protein